MSRKEREGVLWVLLAAAGFAVMPSMVKTTYLHSSFAPFDIAIWRFVIAVPMMWALVYRSRRSAGVARPSDAPIRPMLAIGIVISAAVLAAFFALERLPGSTYIVLFFSYPAMVVVLSALLGERIRPLAWLALAMALAGIVLTVPDLMFGESIDVAGRGPGALQRGDCRCLLPAGQARLVRRGRCIRRQRLDDGRHLGRSAAADSPFAGCRLPPECDLRC